jgi:hypothetical protein
MGQPVGAWHGVVLRGQAWLHSAGSLYEFEGGATFLAPLDAGFIEASGRTVADMLAEIRASSLTSLRQWLGQWVLMRRLPTVSRLSTTLLGESAGAGQADCRVARGVRWEWHRACFADGPFAIVCADATAARTLSPVPWRAWWKGG